MKISLILMAVLFAVVPVLGFSAPSASAEEVVSYPDVINQGDTLYFNPNLIVSVPFSMSSLSYVSSSGIPSLGFSFSKYYQGAPNSFNYVTGVLSYTFNTQGGVNSFVFYFYSIDSSLVGLNLNDTLGSNYPSYIFLESDLDRPILFLDSYLYEGSSSLEFSVNSFDLDTSIFSLTPYSIPTEDSFVGVWGETAEFVGDIFIQVGDLFYDDTAEELTPIGTLAVILAGIAVVLLVWNLIRSFLPMRG